MKKILLLIMTTSLMINCCYAEEIKDTSITEETKIEMSLDEAIEYALGHNANIIDLKLMQKDQREAYDDAKRANQKWSNIKKYGGGYSFEESNDYLEFKGDAFKLAELKYNQYLATQENTKETVKNTVKKLSFGIDEIEKNIVCLEKNIQKLENDVKIAEVKLKLNMITETDLNTANINLSDARSNLVTLKSNLSNTKIALKKIMGIDILKELKITLPEFEYKQLEVENVVQTIENSLEKNLVIIKANIEYMGKENAYVIATETHFMETRDEVRGAKDDYKDAEFRRDNAIKEQKEKIALLYQNLKNNEEVLLTAKGTYEKAKLQFSQATVMYKLGLISKNSFDGYEVGMLNAENTYNSAKSNNILLNSQWESALIVGITE